MMMAKMRIAAENALPLAPVKPNPVPPPGLIKAPVFLSGNVFRQPGLERLKENR
jgi:hypothetical protein